MAKLPETVKQRGRATGAAYRKLLPYIKRDWLIFQPNDIWVGDGHGFKAKVAHPIHGQPFQPEITVIIDAPTRYIVGWSVSLSESTIAHADALRHAMSRHAPPLMYYTDNGAGPTGKMLDADISGILPRLGIEHATGLPGNPQGRGVIERFWQTVTIPLARRYATFVGASADSSTKTLTLRKLGSAMNAERQGKELSQEQRRARAKMPSWRQFLADLEAAINDYNHAHEHSELKTATRGDYATPAAYRARRLAEHEQDNLPLSAAELALMFRPEEIRTVQRGMVDLFGNTYSSVALAEHHGERVRVGYDLHDAQSVLIKTLDGRFVCQAEFNGHVRAAMPMSRMEQKRAERVRNKERRLAEQRALARAELNLPLEHQSSFDALIAPEKHVIDAPYEVLGTGTDGHSAPAARVYKLFED